MASLAVVQRPMTPERYSRLIELFDEAARRSPAERPAFLTQSCAGDEDLLREVQVMLDADSQTGALLDHPAADLAAAVLAAGQSTALIGQKLGDYQVISILAAGGMGEVYLAEDVRLGRKAALKLLPDEYTADPERLRRFEQEARAVSALNHPNIVTLYAVGQAGSTHFLAAEYVEGSTLREQLAAGKMGLPAVLDIAVQTSTALAAAHAAGIVHRDIKPENIMVRPDGLVKVLDFGLAKLAEKQRAAFDFRTDPGAVMGTPAYMSPEQARGFEVGLPSDVFSLGSVIYEMLAGQPAFTGPSSTDVLAAVIGKEPPAIQVLRSEVPPSLVRGRPIAREGCRQPLSKR